MSQILLISPQSLHSRSRKNSINSTQYGAPYILHVDQKNNFSQLIIAVLYIVVADVEKIEPLKQKSGIYKTLKRVVLRVPFFLSTQKNKEKKTRKTVENFMIKRLLLFP